MERGRAIAVLVVCAITCCLSSGTALAGGQRHPPAKFPGSRADPLTSPGGFEIKGSNGYRIVVEAENPSPRGHAEISVFAFRAGAEVIYLTKGIVRGGRIIGDLGPVGRIDVHYVADGRVRHQHYMCREYRGKLPPIYFDGGAYRGTILIRGEKGFTEAHAHRAEGETRWRTGCPEGVSEGFPGPGVVLDSGLGGRGFSAVQNQPGADVLFHASIAERAGPVSIFREVYAWGKATDLVAGKGLRTASVTPPAPFTGSADFVRRAAPGHRASGSWSGDLAVDLPGRADLRLAGSGFEARLYHGFREFHRR